MDISRDGGRTFGPGRISEASGENVKRKMKHLSSDVIRSLNQRLIQMQDELREEIRVAQDDIRMMRESLEGEVRSGSDALELTRFEELRCAEIAVDERKLEAVVEAQRRMSNGLYGTCKDCGVAITTARLLALPTAVRCASCESRWISKME